MADRDHTVSVGAVGSERQIVNVAAGTAVTDAVNFGQLTSLSTATSASLSATNGNLASLSTATSTSLSATNGNLASLSTATSTSLSATNGSLASLSTATSASLSATNGNVASLSTTTSASLSTMSGNVTNLTTNLSTANSNISTNTSNITALEGKLNSGAVGMVQQAAAGADLTVGANTDGAQVNFTGTAGARKLTGVAAGSLAAASSDAVNGAQLFSTNSNLTSLSTSTSISMSLLTSNLNTANSNIATNASNITTLEGKLNSGAVGMVQQAAAGADLTVGANTDGAAVNFAGTAGVRKLSGLADGTAATDAATFGQLTTTNNTVAALDGRVVKNTADITTLAGQIGSGTVGMVQQAAAGADLTVGVNTDGAAVNFAGTAGVRKLSGLADGTAATDAATFGQLTTTNNTVAALDGRVVKNTTDITTLAGQIGSGTVGMVQQAVAGADLTVGANTDGAAVNFSGTAGVRKLSGLADGTAATDAATFGQLTTTNNTVAALDGRVVKNTTDITTLAGQIGSGTVGLVQQAAAGANLTVGVATDGTVVDFTNNGGATRTLTGVAAGVNPNDAVNMTQLTTTNNNVTALGGRVGIAENNITSINTTLADLGASLQGAVVYNSDKSAVGLGGVNGTLINNLAAGLIGAGSMQAVNGGQLFDMQTAWDKKLADLADSSDIAIGDLKQKYDDLSGQVDEQGKQIGDLDDRVGTIESGIADGTIGGGNGGVNPAGNAQVGTGADASGSNSTAIGSGSTASGENSTALGDKSSATGSDSTALGANSSATGSNSVAIGAGSVADRDNSVSFGSPGNERQLTNVADGTEATDAVNKRQLDGAIAGVNDRINRLDGRIDEMGAMSSAQAQMAMSTAGLLGNNRLGVGIGAQNGQSALALGYQRVYAQGTRTLSFGGAASTRGTVSVGAGAGFSW